MTPVLLGHPITLEELESVARRGQKVVLADDAREKVRAARSTRSLPAVTLHRTCTA